VEVRLSSIGDDELERLLGDLESDRVERKETFRGDAPTEVREAVCASANDLPGHGAPGVVFIGAKDNGTPSGLVVAEELLLALADIRSDGNIVPPPTMTVEKRVLRGAELAVLTVDPADAPPVRYRGRTWVRVGPRRDVASLQDERVLNERRRHRDRPFDVQRLTSATLDDLDYERFTQEYLGHAVAPEILVANDRSPVQRLAATKMVWSAEDPTPTVLGILVLSPRARDFLPGAYIQFLRVAGDDLADTVVDESILDGTVTDVLRRVDDKLASHNRVRVDLSAGTTEHRTAEYPMVGLQQVVRNAVMHRNYEQTNAPVRVTWYDDRIEVASPGGPFGAVTMENFGTPGVTDYRNPNLAEALRVLGFVQRFGVGIATARRALAENGNPPPVFEVRAENVNVIIGAKR
jgi:ATP-dependent DNA helicase RecG